MTQLLKLLLNGTLFERIAVAGDSLTSYADAEVKYSSAVLSKIFSHFLLVLLFIGLACVTLTTFLIGGVVALIMILPELNPEISAQSVLLYVFLGLGGVFLTTLAGLGLYLSRIKETFNDYNLHWKE